MPCNLQLGEACLRPRGHGQKRVSNRVGSQCSARKRILRVVCARFDSLSARLRGNENRGPRSEAWNSSKCLGLEGSGQGRRALRERAAGSINRSCGRETTTAAQPRAFQTHAYYRPYQNQARQEQKPHGRRVEQYPPGELITNQRPASAMAAAAAPYDLPAAVDTANCSSGGAPMDPRAPASAVDVVFRELAHTGHSSRHTPADNY